MIFNGPRYERGMVHDLKTELEALRDAREANLRARKWMWAAVFLNLGAFLINLLNVLF